MSLLILASMGLQAASTYTQYKAAGIQGEADQLSARSAVAQLEVQQADYNLSLQQDTLRGIEQAQQRQIDFEGVVAQQDAFFTATGLRSDSASFAVAQEADRDTKAKADNAFRRQQKLQKTRGKIQNKLFDLEKSAIKSGGESAASMARFRQRASLLEGLANMTATYNRKGK